MNYASLPLAEQLNLRAELQQQVADLAEQADDVLTLREQVMVLEERLAPALNYPKVKIGNLLILLDESLPKESWLLSMRVTESVVIYRAMLAGHTGPIGLTDILSGRN